MFVYISSTYDDLSKHRSAALTAVEKFDIAAQKYYQNYQAIAFDKAMPAAATQDEVRNKIKKADYYVLLIGASLGHVPDGDSQSIVEFEYDEAVKKGIPRFCFIADEERPVPMKLIDTGEAFDKLVQFRSKVQERDRVVRFTTPVNLSRKLFALLSGLDKNVVPAEPIWRGRRFKVDDTLCFVAMPLHDPYLSHYKNCMLPVLNEAGLIGQHAGEIFGIRDIMEDVWEKICTSKLMIADLTGRNPNVFYELGIAHTLGKACIVITQNKDDVPFDVQARRYILYDPADLATLSIPLTNTIRSLLA